MTMRKQVISATQRLGSLQEVIDDLDYFVKMPFFAMEKEHEYFDALKDLYFKATNIHANYTLCVFKWAVAVLRE